MTQPHDSVGVCLSCYGEWGAERGKNRATPDFSLCTMCYDKGATIYDKTHFSSIYCFSRVIEDDTIGVVNTHRGMSVHVQECCFLPSCHSRCQKLSEWREASRCGSGILVPPICALNSLSVFKKGRVIA